MGRAALLLSFFLCAPLIARADDAGSDESRAEVAPAELSPSAEAADDPLPPSSELDEAERAGEPEGDGDASQPEAPLEASEAERPTVAASLRRFFDAPIKGSPTIDAPDEATLSVELEEPNEPEELDEMSAPPDLFAEDALLRAVAAASPEIADEEKEKRDEKTPLLVEDRFRYGNLWLIPRGVLSGVAIPLSIPTWNAHQITRMAATTATVTTMMLPLGPSLDVRLYRAMQSARTPFLDALFPKIYTLPMTIGIAAYTTILSAGFYFFKRPRLREYVSLMLESLGIVQFYHVSLKLLIGREGPYQGEGEGRVFGPTRVFFPGGTPSGHTASAFAILITAAEYYGTWPIRILAYVGASYLATSFAYNNQHFASDVIWGAMMGDTVARWVVRHRSSANRGPALRPKLQAAPMVVPGGAGFSLSLSGGGFL